AYIELALAQHQGLFAEPDALDFSPDTIIRLKRHGYPFAGILRLVNVDEVRLSPTDPYFQRVQGQSSESLHGRFHALREKAKELLERLAQRQERNQPQSAIQERSGAIHPMDDSR
ncbi:MAG: hypothetical protein HY731_02375, partial [Candidatus Tectomicrobia bacterium]|nr:hypothetical protein [Candidatus Tectomicrobia bacterium]